jgi:RND family efflux transporter MFP subunit
MKKAYHRKHLLAAGALAAYCLCMMLGCNRADAVVEKGPDGVRPVKTIQLKKSCLNRTRVFPGSAKALQDVDLGFRVSGPLIKFNVDTGMRVTKGEIIARIDPRDFEVQIRALSAKLAASEAQRVESRLQYNRLNSLIKEKGVSKAEFDRSKAIYEMAEARADADSNNLEAARNALKDTALKAPFTGFVHQKYIENHETVTMGQSVVSLVDLSQMEIEIGLPEDLLRKVPDFKKFSCIFNAFPQKKFRADFKEIGKKPNASNRTYPLTLTLKQDESNVIRPGMTAEVTIVMSTDEDVEAFIVPVEAVANDSSRETFVWIFDPKESHVEKRFVQTGKLVTGGIEISGTLHPGEFVVTAGIHFLDEGQRVRNLEPASNTNVGNLL